MLGKNAFIFTVHETMTDTLFNRLTALARKLNHMHSLYPRAHKGTERLTQPATLHCLFPHYLQLAPYRTIKTVFLIWFFFSHSLELFASLPLSDF